MRFCLNLHSSFIHIKECIVGNNHLNIIVVILTDFPPFFNSVTIQFGNVTSVCAQWLKISAKGQYTVHCTFRELFMKIALII